MAAGGQKEAYAQRRFYALLSAIQAYRAEYENSPSILVLAKATEMQKSAVFNWIVRAEKAGLLTRTPGVHRTVRLTEKGVDFVDYYERKHGM